MRPEEDLLLCCSRISMGCENAERIKGLLRKEIDWVYLSQLALRHGVMPLLYRGLRAVQRDVVPREIMDQLQKYFLANAGRNIFFTEALRHLLHLLEAHGIPGIPYKGPALAASIYGDIALRQFSDLDILVRKQDVLKCQDIMISEGYRPDFQLTDVNVKHYLRCRNELSFTRNDGRVIVELQWEIVPRYFSVSIPYEYLWNGTHRSSRSGLGFRAISPEVELIILCVHGTKELWARLLWVCDVAEFIRVNQELDWDWVIELARALGSSRMLFLGLLLGKDLLDTSVPKKVMQQIEVDPVAGRLARQVNKRLFNGTNDASGIVKKSMFYLKTRERLRDRMRYCAHLVTTTTPGDWNLFSLPDYVFPLYVFLRPVRLATKYWLKPLGGILRSPKGSGLSYHKT